MNNRRKRNKAGKSSSSSSSGSGSSSGSNKKTKSDNEAVENSGAELENFQLILELISQLGDEDGDEEEGEGGEEEKNDDNPSPASAEHIMTKLLHIAPKLIKLVRKYRDKEHAVVQLIVSVFDQVENFLKHPETITVDNVRKVFKELSTGWMLAFPHSGNFGQDLNEKELGVLLAFAVDHSMSNDGTAYFDKMDLLNCCLMYLMKHTFYSILLQGGTKSSELTPDLAQELFLRLASFMDASPLCCKGTADDPEGNNWTTMIKQFKDVCRPMGIADYDATNFMYLVGVLGVSLRALYYYANTGKRWTCYVTSLRTMKRGYSNNTYEPMESKYILYLTCNHPNSNMIGWNADAETVENITQQASTFFGAYNGLTLLNGATAFVPPADKLTYFRQKCMTPEEKAARDQIMQIVLAPSHLGKVLALATEDHDLSNLTGARLDSIILPKESDRKLLDEMKIRFGNKFVSMLKGKRKQQLEQYDRSVMKEKNEVKHLAAVVAGQTDIYKLESLDSIKFEGDDNDVYAQLSSKYGSKLLNMLVAARRDWDESALNEMNVLKRLAAVVASKTEDHDLSNLTVDGFNAITFTEEIDRKMCEEMLKRFDVKKLVSMLKIKRNQLLEHEPTVLKHLAAVVAGQTDIYKLESLDSIKFEGNDNTAYNRLLQKYDGKDLLEKLVARRQWNKEKMDAIEAKLPIERSAKEAFMLLNYKASNLSKLKEHEKEQVMKALVEQTKAKAGEKNRKTSTQIAKLLYVESENNFVPIEVSLLPENRSFETKGQIPRQSFLSMGQDGKFSVKIELIPLENDMFLQATLVERKGDKIKCSGKVMKIINTYKAISKSNI